MQDTELFLSLAEIAGVFLGFGALIGVRSASTSDAFELTSIREVVVMGTQVIVVALVPVTLSHYGIAGHEVWLLSSLVFLAVYWGTFAVEIVRVPEVRTLAVATPWARRAVSTLLFAPLNVALVLIALGLFPDQEPALYLTAVVLLVVLAATFLLGLAFSFGRPQTA
jgi:hypothetical protein